MVAGYDPAPARRLLFVHSMLLELVDAKAWKPISTIAAACIADPYLHSIAAYYVGCGKLVAGDYDGAFACFQEFKSVVLSRHREFPIATDEDFNLVVRQALLIEPPEHVRELMAAQAGASPTAPAVTAAGDWRDSAAEGPVFLCCCDSRYFRRFAPELSRSLAAVRPDATLHFHLAGPQDADLALARSLAAQHPTVTFNTTLEMTPLFTQPVYYTCNRFLVAPLLLQRYRRPLLMLDADSLLLDDLGAIIEAARDFDFACFNSGRVEPASVFQAGVMYFAASPGALKLLEILGRLVLAKLALPPMLSWMLDQAALYSAIRYAEKYAPEIAIGDLAAATGRKLTDFLGALGTREEKLELMHRAPGS
ncbi:MAG TPA: hypothetical protein VMC10_00250 [Stellaceae bacterium]|nr:hypothetical protein [Stellaceae bacterium]